MREQCALARTLTLKPEHVVVPLAPLVPAGSQYVHVWDSAEVYFTTEPNDGSLANFAQSGRIAMKVRPQASPASASQTPIMYIPRHATCPVSAQVPVSVQRSGLYVVTMDFRPGGSEGGGPFGPAASDASPARVESPSYPRA